MLTEREYQKQRRYKQRVSNIIHAIGWLALASLGCSTLAACVMWWRH